MTPNSQGTCPRGRCMSPVNPIQIGQPLLVPVPWVKFLPWPLKPNTPGGAPRRSASNDTRLSGNVPQG